MIPREFDYVCPSSLEEVFAALRERPEDAKLLAGGHSLLPLMKLRLASPALLVDLSGVPGLRGVRDAGDYLAVGAMTTYIEAIDDPLVRRHCRPLAAVAGCVGDPQVRHRGTIGGAIAHGDGAGDVPTLALALSAELVIEGPSGTRVVPASDFFIGWFQTALAEDEVLTEVRVPKLDESWGFDYQKFTVSEQGWAIVGACVLVRADGDQITDARCGLTNMAPAPVRARETERLLMSAPAVSDDLLALAADAAPTGTEPGSDLTGDADYRRHLARVLTRRALDRALALPANRPR
jgi:aerobic carbon-monoxide dehydrogenase medium subunit